MVVALSIPAQKCRRFAAIACRLDGGFEATYFEKQMAIHYIDGLRWKRAITAGSRELFENARELNEINVFPVADSDTGTNMVATMVQMLKGLHERYERALSPTVRIAAEEAIIGAKGNSGTILAQFFYGLAEELSGRIRVTTEAFGVAVKNAVRYAYRAIHAPKEGTLLSVLRDWAESIHERCRSTIDFTELLKHSLVAARRSLLNTKNQLAVLKKADVVDAGAAGFVQLIEGISRYIDSGRIEEGEKIPATHSNDQGLAGIAAELDDPNYRYCTECIVEELTLDTKELQNAIEHFGDSCIVAGSQSMTKVHIHTDTPGELFEYLDTVGTVQNRKADDMKRQFMTARSDRADCVLVVDSTCDLPIEICEALDIHIVPIQVLFGEKIYLDKLGLKTSDFYRLMADRPKVIPSTSQPRVADFERIFTFLLEHSKEIMVLSIASALSGTINAARGAVETLGRHDRVHIIDSKSISVAFGLIARRVAEALRAGMSTAAAKEYAGELIRRTVVYVTVPSLDNLVRSGRVSRTTGIIARIANLKPIITLKPDGAVGKGGMVFGVKGGRKKLLDAMVKAIPENHPVDAAIGHANAADDAAWLAREVQNRFTLDRELYVTDVAPALAAHAGLGAVALGFIRPE